MSSADRVKIGVNGAAGRMGRRVVALISEGSGFALAGAYEKEGHPDLGKDAGFVAGCAKTHVTLRVLTASERDLQVLVDFSSPEGALYAVKAAQDIRRPAVVCATGLTADHEKKIREAAKKIAIVYAPNMSLGMNVLMHLTEQAARFLGKAYDVEIVETHHRQKKDAPSGSARGLAESVRRGSDGNFSEVHGRDGIVGARPPGELGVLSVRGGDVVGDHTVHFLGAGDRIELTHRASSRDAFAAGALRAADWVRTAPPGLYGMRDVLGLP
ncbi:4-hydroxy-tetrahydrodipicolinate reductase [bacterium]|nr:4-hydroxy-tetrahydrodipicolinate reductase [bacterium]